MTPGDDEAVGIGAGTLDALAHNASRQAELLHEISAQARERGLERPVPRLLDYLVKWHLDISMPLDEIQVSKVADHHGMQILAKCRDHGASRLPAEVWKALRMGAPVVWRILIADRKAA